jgi:homoserine kinase
VIQEQATGVASAPATTANLGPAFDCLGLALDFRCQVSARLSDAWTVDHTGLFRPSPAEGDAVLSAARRVVGDARPLALEVDSSIPIGKGLGSSAAAFVAGAAAALRAVGDEANPDHVFRLAAGLEGHPDNVAAAVYGGLVLVPAEGLPIRLPIHPTLRVVVAIPASSLPTDHARRVIDTVHAHPVVRRSLARVAALTAGLITGDPQTLAAAHGDEIHEAPRAELSPEVNSLIELAKRAGALHAARSGSGPSVVALCSVDQASRVAGALRESGVEVLEAAIATSGLICG